MIRRIFRNFSWLSVAAAFELGLGMVVTAVLARCLGPTGFGQYSLWLAFVALFTPLYDFGLTAFSLREVAQNPKDASDHIKGVVRAKLFLSLLGFFVVFGFAYGLGYFRTLLSAIAFVLLAISQIVRTFSLLNRAIFRANEWMHLQAYVEAVGNIVRLLLILGVISIHPDLVWVCLVLAAVNMGEFVASSVIIRIRTKKLSTFAFGERIRTPFKIGQLIKKSTPFALYDLLNGLYMRADTVLLGSIAGLQAVAWYSSAYKLATLIGLIPRTLMDGVYPILCKETKERVYLMVHRLLIGFLFLAFPVCLTLTLFAPEIIRLVYGAEYTPAILALQLLAWASFFVFGSSLLLATLNALHLEKAVAKIMAVIAVSGFMAYIPSIRLWGFIGACVFSTGIEAAGFLFMYIFVQRKFKRQLLSIANMIRILFAYGIAIFVVSFGTVCISKWFDVIIAITIYSLTLLLYSVRSDWVPKGFFGFRYPFSFPQR